MSTGVVPTESSVPFGPQQGQRSRTGQTHHRDRQWSNRSPSRTTPASTSAYRDHLELSDAHRDRQPGREAVADVPGVGQVRVELDVMNDEQRTALRKARGDKDEPVIPFAQPGSLTRCTRVASGKGRRRQIVDHGEPGHRPRAERGLSVGVLDADIYGHSGAPHARQRRQTHPRWNG